eukprot:6755114-Prymnesium_polylepis.1
MTARLRNLRERAGIRLVSPRLTRLHATRSRSCLVARRGGGAPTRLEAKAERPAGATRGR